MLPPWHGSIGAILLALVVIRIIWAFSQIRNRQSESFLAKAGHILLYVFMFLAPVSAFCLMLGNGYGVKVFGTSIIAGGNAIPSLLQDVCTNQVKKTQKEPKAPLFLIQKITHKTKRASGSFYNLIS